MKTRLLSLLLLFTINSIKALPQDTPHAPLRQKIDSLIKSSHAHVGISIIDLESGKARNFNGDGHFPMQSTFKFPLAIVILQQVDKGKLSLNRQMHIPKNSLDTATWSPMVKAHPHQDIDLPLAEVLRYMVSMSDNNACDMLFKEAGGTKKVNEVVHSWGLTGINIVATEREMKKAWMIQYSNWEQPRTATSMLEKFYKGQLLSKSSQDFLYQLMLDAILPERLKGQLPPEAIVAHKTGTSDRNKQGLLAACNDIGIITTPNGKHYAIAVFLSDTKKDDAAANAFIATISKAVWDEFTTTTK